MKKLMVLTALLASGLAVLAAMDDKTYNVTVIGTTTNSANVVLRGELEAVKIDVPNGATGTVTVATSDGTVFSKADIAADVIYFPRVALHTTAGVAATFVGGTNDTANAWYGKAPLAGDVTVTVIGQSAGTNAYSVKVIYNK